MYELVARLVWQRYPNTDSWVVGGTGLLWFTCHRAQFSPVGLSPLRWEKITGTSVESGLTATPNGAVGQ